MRCSLLNPQAVWCAIDLRAFTRHSGAHQSPPRRQEPSMNTQLPFAVRATSAAFAVFATMATLSATIAMAEPQQSELIAQVATRQAAQAALSAPQAVWLAQADTIDH